MTESPFAVYLLFLDRKITFFSYNSIVLGYRVTEAYSIHPDELCEVIGGYDALLCHSATKVTEDVVAAGDERNLEIVASATSGMDHVDIAAAEAAEITVCHTPFTVTQANAEYNISTLIALSRNLRVATHQVQEGGWDQQAVLGQEIGGRNLGIVGFGRIGKRTAQLANTFGMQVCAYDPYVDRIVFEQQGVEQAALDDLMIKSDYVVVQVPRTPETTGMIGERELSLMRTGGYLVQVLRGSVVAESPMIIALRNGHLAGTAVDVFENEPHVNPELRQFARDGGNVILTPHIGCSTQDSGRRAGMSALGELDRYFTGGRDCNIR